MVHADHQLESRLGLKREPAGHPPGRGCVEQVGHGRVKRKLAFAGGDVIDLDAGVRRIQRQRHLAHHALGSGRRTGGGTARKADLPEMISNPRSEQNGKPGPELDKQAAGAPRQDSLRCQGLRCGRPGTRSLGNQVSWRLVERPRRAWRLTVFAARRSRCACRRKAGVVIFQPGLGRTSDLLARRCLGAAPHRRPRWRRGSPVGAAQLQRSFLLRRGREPVAARAADHARPSGRKLPGRLGRGNILQQREAGRRGFQPVDGGKGEWQGSARLPDGDRCRRHLKVIAAQGISHGRRRRKAFLHVAVQGTHDGRLDGGWNVGSQSARRQVLALQDGAQDGGVALARERRRPTQHLVQHHPGRVDVGAMIDLRYLTDSLLRRHVQGRAHHCAHHGPAHGRRTRLAGLARRKLLGDAKVDDLDEVGAVLRVDDEDVVRLEVAVDDAVLVGC